MFPKLFCNFKTKATVLLFASVFSFSSCYTYRIQTHAQAGTEATTGTMHSFFWGLAQKPPNGMMTPNCDTLGSLGMSVVTVKSNIGYSLITIATLGIWSPIRISYKCSKPCPKNGTL